MTTQPMIHADPDQELVPPVRQPLEPWNVVLLDDNEHTYEYVIEMLHRLLGHALPECYMMAREVDTVGRVVVLTTHRERAELERDRISAYGADPRITNSRGSMRVVLERASRVGTIESQPQS